MNAHQLIEGEDPKAFLKQHAPPRLISIICPIQGQEDEYDQGVRSLVRVHNSDALPDDLSLYPDWQSWFDEPTYEWPDLYVTEIIAFCQENGIKIADAWRSYPDDKFLLREAEDPKNALRQLSQRQIWPSDQYFLNLWPEGDRWQSGEFCPGQVNFKNEFMQFDGMYGLTDDVYNAIGVAGDEPTPAQEKQFEEEYNKYSEPIYSAIKRGETSGTVTGIAGTKKWQLLFAPHRGVHNWNSWIETVQPVKAGQRYGDRLKDEDDRSQWAAFRQEALNVADTILEGEDPKQLLRANFGRPQGVYVVRTEWIDPHYPPFEEVYDNERKAAEALRKHYITMPGGEWRLKLIFRPHKKLGQPPTRSKTLLTASYDQGDRQLTREINRGADLMQAFRDYKARTDLDRKIGREAYRRFPNTGQPVAHHITGEMHPQPEPENRFQRDDYFRATWRQRAGHPADCECYRCLDLRRPSAREHHAEQEQRKADAYRRWKRAVARAKRLGQPPPPEPQRSGFGRGYGRYDY